MTQTKLNTKSVAQIGEEIGLELGLQMVKSYQDSNPADVTSYLIGREIIDQILAQPGCAGLKFYNAYNESGEKTLVYVGVDSTGNSIIEVSSVGVNGIISTEKGIVADRVRPNNGPSRIDADNWGFETE